MKKKLRVHIFLYFLSIRVQLKGAVTLAKFHFNSSTDCLIKL